MTDIRALPSNNFPSVEISDPDVLIVDDEASALRLMTLSLEGAGFVVEGVGSGEDALAAIEKRTPNLVVLDYEMPGINGVEVCARIRSSNKASIKKLPIIMVTAHCSEAEEIACLQAGANDFVTKPVSRAVLVARIQTQLRLRAYARELEEWREVHRADLKSARATQQAMLPARFPEIDGWEVQTHYQPMIEVGGDIYGWEPLGQGRWAFWMADSTGHGAAAALTTALTVHLFNKAAEMHRSPADILAFVNREFTNGIGGQTFMTACCAVLSPDGSIRLSSAGHPPILVRRSNGCIESIFPERTLLGVGKQMAIPDTTAYLHPGDMALLYTDGLYAMNSKTDGERFTHKIVEEKLSAFPSDHNAIHDIMNQIAGEADDKPPDDDLTVIMLRRKTE
jgi:sigma-B regulation protein RsbU (phosphoserine phosphatase)